MICWFRGVAQSVTRTVRVREVGGSNPLAPTTTTMPLHLAEAFLFVQVMLSLYLPFHRLKPSCKESNESL